MALIFADRIQETTATTGTGSLTLGGALTGYKTFNSEMANADTCYYCIDNGLGSWELGIGTYTDTDVLARTSVIKSSNSDSLVNFSAGSKNVFLTTLASSIAPQSYGTFTPVVAGTTVAGAGTYSEQLGSYVKMGRLVSFRLNLSWTAHTGTGNYLITGLPYAVESVANAAVSLFMGGITFSGIPVAQILTNTANIGIYTVASNALHSALAIDTDYTVTPQTFRISGTYITA